MVKATPVFAGLMFCFLCSQAWPQSSAARMKEPVAAAAEKQGGGTKPHLPGGKDSEKSQYRGEMLTESTGTQDFRGFGRKSPGTTAQAGELVDDTAAAYRRLQDENKKLREIIAKQEEMITLLKGELAQRSKQ